MSSDETDDEEDDIPFDLWDEFRIDDREPISIAELEKVPMSEMPDDIHVWVMDDYFPETTISRDGDALVCHIEDQMYTKFWEHKFSAYAFSHAMDRAVRRLAHEGHPFANPTCDDEDVHIFVQWDVRLPADMPPNVVVESIKAAYDLVNGRADAILDNSDSVLVLGKDTGVALDLLKRIAAHLEDLGYFTYIIKEQPDKVGEGIIQKVMRYALSSKFVVVENTEPSGHLYEIPHVAKMAECVTAVLQEQGKGATWMFEDGYAKHPHWHKFEYQVDHLELTVNAAAAWAEEFVKGFGDYQNKVLPWMKPKGGP
jgi:hypothetical protein